MNARGCVRLWEAEAVADGRLGQAERASFERHAQSCGTCRHESAALLALHTTMRQAPALESTAFEHQRQRNRLLERVDRELVGAGEARWRARRLMVVLATASSVLVAGIAVGAFGGAKLGRSALPAPVVNQLPKFELHSMGRAAWDDRSVGSVARVVVKNGVVAVNVQPLCAAQRFLLVLPDGELEVHGTRFVVRVEEQRTSRVDVSEGAVSLRLDGMGERTLLAGDHWERPLKAPPESLPASPSVARSAEPTPAPGPKLASAPMRARVVAEAPPAPVPSAAPTKPSENAAASVAAPTPSAFAVGMAAFRRGDYAVAERSLGEFGREAASDPRAEDAAFIRAVARSRLGDARGAAALAQSYLNRYPSGLRRSEAERIVRAAP